MLVNFIKILHFIENENEIESLIKFIDSTDFSSE